jgi:hypothetical protein
MERRPNESDLLRHEETPDMAAHLLKVDSFEHWMAKVDEGVMDLATAKECHEHKLQRLGLIATESGE